MKQGTDIASVLRPADVLLIVPPFAYLDRPALGVHLLQGLARRGGLEVQVLYSNLFFAAWFDVGTHTTLSKVQHSLLGERMFARAAFGGPPLGRDGGAALLPEAEALRLAYLRSGVPLSFTLATLLAIEARIPTWLDSFVPQVNATGVSIVGCTSSFEQNAGSIAILSAVKARRPETTTIMGGANCEGEMAEGILSLTNHVDHVFSGESEQTFLAFLERHRRGEPSARILHGEPCTNLDALPTPDYADYYEQLRAFLPDNPMTTKGLVCLSAETSRGCWWGAKSHCTFCGLNGQGMASREKSPDRVVSELRTLVAAHPVADAGGVSVDTRGVIQGRRDAGKKLVVMTDNIMPHAYFRTVLPRLAAEVPEVTLMYEMKANLSLAQVRALMRAGVTEIQPGIEALSTGLLKLMAKGTTAAQNLALLRYGSATGMYLYWNLLYGFPNDEAVFYTETLELLPLIHHLQPPTSCFPVIFDRFSPYFDHPERYGITNLRPAAGYRDVYPETAALDRVAYHFEGTCAGAAVEHPELPQRMIEEVAAWRRRFYAPGSVRLTVARHGRDAGSFVLTDTRGLPGLPEQQIIDEDQAAMALVPHPLRGGAPATGAWARAHALVVERDHKLVPLAVADPALLAEMEERHRRSGELRLAI